MEGKLESFVSLFGGNQTAKKKFRSRTNSFQIEYFCTIYFQYDSHLNTKHNLYLYDIVIFPFQLNWIFFFS